MITETTPEAMVKLRFEISRQLGEALSEILPDIDPQATIWFDEDHPTAALERFCRTPGEAAEHQAKLTPLLELCAPDAVWTVTTSLLPATDWTQSWKQFFHVQRISERLVIRPSWEAYTAGPTDCVVTLDPGLSFGTGLHGTTQACLAFLDQRAQAAARPASVLDVGCGSGILAIAAAKLGYQPVLGIDLDPQAVQTAEENSRRNAVAGQIAFRVADLADFAPDRTFDVVAANLLAPLLIEQAPRLARLAGPAGGGDLLLAGILETQYAAVAAAYRALGFTEHQTRIIGEWKSGWLRRVCCLSPTKC